ncbi:hypothetical protein LINPERHAP1_LOCUS27113 [Linum perenne]
MRGELSTETAVEAPASEVWAAYRGVELGRLVTELMGDSLGRADVLSVVKLTFPPGTYTYIH